MMDGCAVVELDEERCGGGSDVPSVSSCLSESDYSDEVASCSRAAGATSAEAAEGARRKLQENGALRSQVATLESHNAQLLAANRELAKLKVRKRAVRIATLEAANKKLEVANIAHRDNETMRNTKLKKFYERRCVALHEEHEKQLRSHRQVSSALQDENARLVAALRHNNKSSPSSSYHGMLLDEADNDDLRAYSHRRKKLRLTEHEPTSGMSEVNGRLVKIKLDHHHTPNAVCRGCRRNSREILFLPCSHLVLCAECANRADSCPCCANPIASKHFASVLS